MQITAKTKRGARPNGRKPTTEKKPNSLEPVKCPECGEWIARKFLPRHMEKKHGLTTAQAAQETTAPGAA